jgi:hypothetical protein
MGRKLSTENPSSYTPDYYRLYYHKHNAFMKCECGKPVRKFGIYAHRKTKGHLTILEIARLHALLDKQEKRENTLGESATII